MSPVQMTLYSGRGCSNCAALETWFASRSPENFSAIIRKDIYTDRESYEELRQIGKAYGIPEEFIGIPFLAMGDTYLMGYSGIVAFLESNLPK